MNQYIKSMSGRMVFLGVFLFLDLLVPCNTRFVRLYIEVEYFWVLKVLESNRIPSLKSIVLAMPW